MKRLSWLTGPNPAPRPGTRRKPAGSKLLLEPLDDRALPSFLSPVNYAVDPYSQAVATADFNGDGKLDLATSNYGNGIVSVLLGKGDGTFQPAVNSATGSGALSLAVGDFNADGKLDVATVNAYDVSVLLGNGDGTFQAPGSLGVVGNPQSVAVGDFDGDGKMDIGVASNVYVIDGYSYGYYGGLYPFGHSEGQANVLLGNGSGGFSGPNVTDLGYGYHTAAAAADLNGDGFDDLVTDNADGGTVGVLLGDGSGYLQGPADFFAGYHPWSVAAGDVNGDGHTDLVTANAYDTSVGVLLGDGAGNFDPAMTYPTGGYPTQAVLADFTGDGRLDVATANPYSDTVSVLYGNGDGTLSTAVDFAAGSNPLGIAAGDFNGDGWPDAATIDSGGSNVSVLTNDRSWPSLPAPYVSINDATATEGNTGSVNVAFTVSLSAAYDAAVTVHYATANGTATAGSDYTAGSGDVTFAPGQTSKTVTVAVLGDRLAEPTETFAVNLSAPTNAFIGDGQGVGTILDDEPRISINSVAKKEGNGGTTQFVFTVSLSVAYDQAVTVNYSTANGTATVGSDYQAKSGTLTFAPGQTTRTITIVVYGDKKGESNETFFVNLSGPSANALFLAPQGTGTILDDDTTHGHGKH